MEVQKQYPLLYPLSLGIALVLFGVWLGGMIFKDFEGYAINVYTSILSIAVTVFVLDKLAQRREEEREIRQLKVRLVREAGGRSNEAAKRAVDELRANGWLQGVDSLLQGEHFGLASLEGANLVGANLKGARMRGVNLENASILWAELESADLTFSNLDGVNLHKTNLEGVDLEGASLEGADLVDANLKGANLINAKLKGANVWGVNFEGAKFDENTTLPDDSKWTPKTDMAHFTDPHHPEFWHPWLIEE